MLQANSPRATADDEPELLEPNPASLVSPHEQLSDYTPEVLQNMRRLCLPKPAIVPESLWKAASPAPAHLNRSKFDKALAAGTQAGDRSVFGALAPLAYEAIYAMMTDPAESSKIRSTVSMYVLDQFVGKANQAVEHSGTVFHDVRSQLRDLEAKYAAVQAADATTAKSLASPASPFDNFIAQHSSENFSVGKRGSSGEESNELSELSQESEQQPTEGLSAGASEISSHESSQS